MKFTDLVNKECSILKYASKLRLLEETCDLILMNAQGFRVSAHRMIIGGLSTYISDAIYSASCIENPITIVIPEADAMTLGHFLAFAYKGEFNFKDEGQLYRLFDLMELLRIDRLGEISITDSIKSSCEIITSANTSPHPEGRSKPRRNNSSRNGRNTAIERCHKDLPEPANPFTSLESAGSAELREEDTKTNVAMSNSAIPVAAQDCLDGAPDGRLDDSLGNMDDPLLTDFDGSRSLVSEPTEASSSGAEGRGPCGNETVVIKVYTCKVCKYSSKHNTALQNHVRIHTGEKPFECKLCPAKFRQKTNLNEHMKIHTGERPFECKFCSNKFRTASNLRKHAKIHTEQGFACSMCSSKFKTDTAFERHKLRKHKGKGIDMKNRNLEQAATERNCSAMKWQMDHDAMTTSDELLDENSNLEHPVESIASTERNNSHVADEDSVFRCTFCDYKAPNRKELTNHLRIHSGGKPQHCKMRGAHISNEKALEDRTLGKSHSGRLKSSMHRRSTCKTVRIKGTDIQHNVRATRLHSPMVKLQR